MGINRTGISKVVIIPYRIQDLFSGKCDSLILQKICQKFKFLKAQFHRLTIHSSQMCCFIYNNAACWNHIFRIILTCTSQNCLHSCNKDFRTEWFGDVFIYPQIKSKKLISLITSCSQHNDRNFWVLANLTANFPSIHLRHHDVQNDQCDVLLLIKDIHGFFTITGFQYLEILLCQEILYQLSHAALIIHHQDF